MKTILITGAKGGLGTFVTRAFLNAGVQVVGASHSISDADFPHPRFAGLAGALSTGDDAHALVRMVLARFGRIDGLVHLIGAFAGGQAVAETDDATVEKMMAVNFNTAFYMIRAVLPHMRAQGGGRIVAIGSKAAVEPQAMVGAYAASKAAVVSLVRTVARENTDANIAANIVLPGTMDTPANRAAMPAADFSKWVQPGQVADLLVHLVCGGAANINGAVIPVLGVEA